jgi:hypothetical protein
MTDAFPYRLCVVRYRFAGNGPWNYALERPPPGVRFVYQVGYYIGRTKQHLLIASNLWVGDDGKYHPTHCQHYDLDTEIAFYDAKGQADDDAEWFRFRPGDYLPDEG